MICIWNIELRTQCRYNSTVTMRQTDRQTYPEISLRKPEVRKSSLQNASRLQTK